MLRTIRDLSEDKRVILVGGQAVAFWINFLEDQFGQEIGGARPTTSKDIDFEGSSRDAIDTAERLGGKAFIADIDHQTPNTAVVEYVDGDGWLREIDFLESPFGLAHGDVRNSAVLLHIPDGAGGEVPLWVMHPERCVESRVANVMVLKTLHPLAMDQLRASLVCARLFSAFVLEQGQRRQVLNTNERIFVKCLHDQNFRRLHAVHEIDPFDAVLVDPRLGKFVSMRYPQMTDALKARRERDAEIRAAHAGRRG